MLEEQRFFEGRSVQLQPFVTLFGGRGKPAAAVCVSLFAGRL
jgi:hypothetical protein